MSEDTTLLQGLVLANGRFSPCARVYYYQGNFYWPFVGLHPSQIGKIKGAVRRFTKENASMIEADRNSPNYKTLVELFDEQMEKVDAGI